jgi:hypothetical protein
MITSRRARQFHAFCVKLMQNRTVQDAMRKGRPFFLRREWGRERVRRMARNQLGGKVLYQNN